MLLAIDARNRSLTCGLRDGSSWQAIHRFGVAAERSADEYALLLSTLGRTCRDEGPGQSLGRGAGRGLGGSPEVVPSRGSGDGPESLPSGGPGGVPGARVAAAWIASVVPALTPRLVEAVATAFGVEAVVIGPGVRTGVKIRTDQPAELGADLVCAAAAAFELARGACIVVDFGAALTLSAINHAGEFLGAAIAPGIAAAAESLRSSAALLPEVRLEIPGSAIGKSTAGAVQAGILLGYQGLVRALIERMSAELLADSGAAPTRAGEASPRAAPAIIGTGEAMGRRILAACGHEHFVPELVLEGISLIATRTAKK